MRALLRNRPLVMVGLAETVGGAGNWVTALAVYALVIFRGGGGTAQSGAILMAGLLPALLASPLAGVLCDRFDRKWLMVVSELLSGLAVLGLIFARQPALIYGLLALQSAFGAVLMPARQAAVPQIVAREQLTRANALLQQLAGAVKIGGPMLGGLLLAVMEPHRAMALNVVALLLSALILSRLPALPAARAVAVHERRPQDLAGPGLLDLLRRVPLLLFFLLVSFLAIALVMSFDVLGTIYTRDVLRSDESFFGLLVGLIGSGMVAATLLLMVRRGVHDPIRDLALCPFLLGCIPASLALGAGAPPAVARWLAAGGCLLGGLGGGIVTVQMSTLLQLTSPPALLGRLGGLFQSTITAGQLTAVLLVPLLVPQVLSMGSFFALAGLAMALLGVATGAAWRRATGVPVAAPEGV